MYANVLNAFQVKSYTVFSYLSEGNVHEVLEVAKGNNVVILLFPSHSTHRLQQYDVSFFRSLKASCDDKAQTRLINHPGRAITEAETISIFDEAYRRAANVTNAASGFKKTGIHPFDPSEVEEMEFATVSVTDSYLTKISYPLSKKATVTDAYQVRQNVGLNVNLCEQ